MYFMVVVWVESQAKFSSLFFSFPLFSLIFLSFLLFNSTSLKYEIRNNQLICDYKKNLFYFEDLGLSAVEQNGPFEINFRERPLRNLYILCAIQICVFLMKAHRSILGRNKFVFQIWSEIDFVNFRGPFSCGGQSHICHSKLRVSAFVKSLIRAATFFSPSRLFSYAESPKKSKRSECGGQHPPDEPAIHKHLCFGCAHNWIHMFS